MMRPRRGGWMRIRHTEFLFTLQLQRILFPALAGIAPGCCCSQIHGVHSPYSWCFNSTNTKLSAGRQLSLFTSAPARIIWMSSIVSYGTSEYLLLSRCLDTALIVYLR